MDNVLQQRLEQAGDDYDRYYTLMAEAAELKRQYPFEVPTVEEMKGWIREAMNNGQ